jgi:hypothetical protein
MKKRKFLPESIMKNVADTGFDFIEIAMEERLDSTGSPHNAYSAIYVPPHAYDARLVDWTVSPENW